MVVQSYFLLKWIVEFALSAYSLSFDLEYKLSVVKGSRSHSVEKIVGGFS